MLLEIDGWYLSYWKGDHRQFKHPIKRIGVGCIIHNGNWRKANNKN